MTSYVEGVTGADVVSAQRVAEQEVGACHYGVWDVRTTRHRWWVVATRGRYAGLPVTLYDRGDFASAAKLISYKVKAQRQVATEMKKLLGKRAKALPVTC